MATTLVYDFSEWQGTINWNAYPGNPAICRAHYGTSHVDAQIDANIAGARSRCRVRGWYGYLVAGQDPSAQADVMCRIIAAHGGLQPGEFIVCDCEEGSGDLSGAVNTYLSRCDQVLHEAAGSDWAYSGLYFWRAHLGRLSGRHRWLAAYGQSEPGDQHDLWQDTDAATVAGVAGHVDCSIFRGSIDDLATLVGAGGSPGPSGGDDMDPVLEAKLDTFLNVALVGSDGRAPKAWLVDILGAVTGDASTTWGVVQDTQARLRDAQSVLVALQTAVATLKAGAGGVVDLSPIEDHLTALDQHQTAMDGHLTALRTHLGDPQPPSTSTS